MICGIFDCLLSWTCGTVCIKQYLVDQSNGDKDQFYSGLLSCRLLRNKKLIIEYL